MVLAGSMFFLVPRGQGSINFLQRSLACAEHAAGTQPWGGQTRSFFRFLLYFIYFLFNEPSLMPAGTSKPLPLLPQPSATSTRKTAKSDTRQLLGGNVSMFLPLTTPDSSKGLLHHRRHDVLCYAVSLCRIYFSNQGIAKPQCVAT